MPEVAGYRIPDTSNKLIKICFLSPRRAYLQPAMNSMGIYIVQLLKQNCLMFYDTTEVLRIYNVGFDHSQNAISVRRSTKLD